ncbi:MAG: segregation and condensation protein A [Candidatus Limnocylindrales bacterium]
MVEARPAMTPAVIFGAGHRPEASTQVRLDAFEGPLALLLSLIEARQLDVMTVPLGALAGAYLDALAGLETDRIGNVSGFVAIAGQLILIKSRALLPRRTDPAVVAPEEAPDPEAELRARLILYRAHRDAGLALQAAALLRVGLFRREPTAALAAGRAGAVAPAAPAMDPGLLAAGLEQMLRVVSPPPPPPASVPRTVTIAQHAELIRAALRGADWIVLQDLLAGVRDRMVVVVTFLAMLELVKRREIVVEQAVPWGPIVARPTTPDERAAMGGLAPETPIDESLESFA